MDDCCSSDDRCISDCFTDNCCTDDCDSTVSTESSDDCDSTVSTESSDASPTDSLSRISSSHLLLAPATSRCISPSNTNARISSCSASGSHPRRAHAAAASDRGRFSVTDASEDSSGDSSDGNTTMWEARGKEAWEAYVREVRSI